MTETSAASPEPTNAEILAFMQTAFSQLTTEIAGVKADLRAQGQALAALSSKVSFVDANQNVMSTAVVEMRGEMRGSFQTVARDTAAVREDVAGVKSDTAFVERWNQDMHEAFVRHIADPNAHRDAA